MIRSESSHTDNIATSQNQVDVILRALNGTTMKRNMDLVRRILLETEQSKSVNGWIDLSIEGYSPEVISYHVKILAEADLLEAKDLSTRDGFGWQPKSLTWKGHEFLDAARNETVWKKTTDLVKDKGGSVPFEVLKDLLIKFATTFFSAGSSGV
jgi:DNA-binding transcriptional ArsR family regulator